MSLSLGIEKCEKGLEKKRKIWEIRGIKWKIQENRS
jgi:hypothetical protein